MLKSWISENILRLHGPQHSLHRMCNTTRLHTGLHTSRLGNPFGEAGSCTESWIPLSSLVCLMSLGTRASCSHASRQRAELEADYSSVRASVRPSPSSGKLKTYAFAPYHLKFQKITYVFYCTFLTSPSKHIIKLILFSSNAQNTP